MTDWCQYQTYFNDGYVYEECFEGSSLEVFWPKFGMKGK